MKRFFLRSVAVVLLVSGAVVAWAAWDFFHFLERPLAAPVTVEVQRGWSMARIADVLEQRGVVASSHWFLLLARAEHLRTQRTIQAGEYGFERGERPQGVLAVLLSGAVLTHRLVVPEGWTVAEVGARMKAQGWSGVETLLEDPATPGKLGLNVPSLEGWLFPSTYHYLRGDSAWTMLTRMVKESQRVMDALWRVHRADETLRPHAVALSRFETLILASIIEKETGRKGERRRISAVFHNRLRKKMRLQSDPTVIYGLLQGPERRRYNGNLTRKHLRTSTPFNTYTEFGLPPTPICNPGRASLLAAMNPDKTDEIFFVARGDGGHVFSKTLKAHEANVDRYQRRRGSTNK